MKPFLLAAALLSLVSPALGFDMMAQGVVASYKANKVLKIDDVAKLMRGSERWCYSEESGSCAWSDIYLDVGVGSAKYEISSMWDEALELAFVDRGEFRDGRYICETGYDWVPSVRATRRSDGVPLGGRELEAVRSQITLNRADDTQDCFDYVFLSGDIVGETARILQRQYIGGVTDPAHDTVVTLHFNAAEAAALTSR